MLSQQVLNYYNDVADDYDLIFVDHVSESERTLQVVSQVLEARGIKPETVLDVGCGTGWDIVQFAHARLGTRYYGFDLSTGMVERAKQCLANQNLQAQLWVADVLDENLGFQEYTLQNTFDVVIFRGNSLSHIAPEMYNRAFSNIYTCLKPGGAFIFDLRDGRQLFKERKPIELRGSGFDANRESFYFSAYFQEHPQIISERYEVTVVLVQKPLQSSEVKTKFFTISAHYVLPDVVVDSIREVGFNSCDEVTHEVGESLPFLHTFVATK